MRYDKTKPKEPKMEPVKHTPAEHSSLPPAMNMTSGEPTRSWVERHWYWLTILFGILFVLWIDSFSPTW